MRRLSSRSPSSFRGRAWSSKLCVAAAILIFATAADLSAANVRWSGQGGNTLFHNSGNWTGGLIPGVIDIAQFGRSVQLFPQSYTVSFNNNATNQALHIEDDQVTFDLNSRVYTVTAADGVLVGLPGNFAGRLTVLDGTLVSSTKIDVGAAANRVGFLTVGAGGLISGAANLNVGKLATGTLTVQAGGDISLTGATLVGVGNGITATANIVGDGTMGSATLLTGGLNVGDTGNGTVNVQLGGLLENSGTVSVGGGDLFTGVGTGTVNVMNPGSVWNSQGLLKVGDAGSGEVNVMLGGKLTSVDSIIGADVSNSGEVNVDGTNSRWENSGTLTVGGIGNGTLNITGQGAVETMTGLIGSVDIANSSGTVNVSGAGSLWTITDGLSVGYRGTGALNIADGGSVLTNSGVNPFSFIGNEIGATGSVTVDGSGSVWEHERVSIGYSGVGMLTITNGAAVRTFDDGHIGEIAGSSGIVAVNGATSVWEYSGKQVVSETDADLIIGDAGEGTLEITGGGRVISTATSSSVLIDIGAGAGSTGVVRVAGEGSLWDAGIRGRITVGNEGSGTLEITDGGAVKGQFHDMVIGAGAGSTGVVRVAGEGSLWDTGGGVAVGIAGSGMLEINDGGVVQAQAGGLGIGYLANSFGIVTVSGSGSLTVGDVTVGRDGHGTFEITSGGHVQTSGIEVYGVGVDNPSILKVDGPGSRLEQSALLHLGDDSFLIISGGGEVIGCCVAAIGVEPAAEASVTVTGAGSTWEVGSTIGLGANGGTGILRIQPGATVVGGSSIAIASSSSLLSLEGGTLSTSVIDFHDDFANAETAFEWTSGTLHVGRFDGDLVNQAGVLAPGNLIGETIVEGDYNQLAGATLQIELGGTTDGDNVIVEGNAFFAGELEIGLLNGFVPNPTDTLTVLTAGLNIFASFDNVANGQRLPTSNGLGSFVVNYGAGSAFDPRQIVLSSFLPVPGLPGDYNQNGAVDAADYVVWRDNLGSPDALPNDDTPGVGPDDYDRWKTNFGQNGASGSISSSVPESTAFALFVPTALLAILRRCRNNFTDKC